MARIRMGYLLSRGKNLADLIDKAAARLNLGLGSAATHDDGRYAHRSNALSDVHAPTARANLGLGGAAVLGQKQVMRRDQAAITESGHVEVRSAGNRHVYFQTAGGGEEALIYHSAAAGVLVFRLRNNTNTTQAQIQLNPNGDINASTGRWGGNGSGLTNVNADTLNGWKRDSIRNWPNIRNKPATALRWPHWNEISGKPANAVNTGVGQVGTYAFLRCLVGGTGTGGLRNGSGLRWAAAYGDNGSSPVGTWQCMGWNGGGNPDQEVTLWLRIA